MRVKFPVLVMAILVAVVSSSRHVATQSGTPSYGMNTLPTLGGATNVAFAFDLGASAIEIYGYSTTTSGSQHAFAVTDRHNTTDLGTLGGSSSDVRGSWFGVVTGRAQLANGHFHAFIGNGYAAQSLQDIGTLGDRRASDKASRRSRTDRTPRRR